jgi:glycosyltransferase involved in cell wall biosynthesis
MTPGQMNVGQRKLLFCSYHCADDRGSGAALSARDLLALLQGRNWNCRILCGPHIDTDDTSLVARRHAASLPDTRELFSVINSSLRGVPLALFKPDSATLPPSLPTGYAFVALLDRLLERDRPDVVLTYGGHWIGRAIISCAKQRGVPVVFWLRNCEYTNAQLFGPVDGIIVPCKYSQQYYQQRLGLQCTVIPTAVDWSAVQCDKIEGRFVTFVNPQPTKGLYWFLGIAKRLAEIRPDIPLLVVDGRAGSAWRAELAVHGLANVQVMPPTDDPRDFYRITRMIVMPSLWKETLARVPIEAFINGIPVLASRRGGLVENLARAGVLLDIPARYTPETREIPCANEVAKWIETIIRLWDDESAHQAERDRSMLAAKDYRPEMLDPCYEEFFEEIALRSKATATSEDDNVLSLLRTHLPSEALKRQSESLTAMRLDGLLLGQAGRSDGADYETA